MRSGARRALPCARAWTTEKESNARGVGGTRALARDASTRVDALRERLSDGPGFDDFVRGDAAYSVPAPKSLKDKTTRKPTWLKREVPGGERYTEIKSKLRELKLATVCEEAKCPNLGECWGGGRDGRRRRRS